MQGVERITFCPYIEKKKEKDENSSLLFLFSPCVNLFAFLSMVD
jgi:hypothetical protein